MQIKFNLHRALIGLAVYIAVIMFVSMIAASCAKRFDIAVVCGVVAGTGVFAGVGLVGDEDDDWFEEE